MSNLFDHQRRFLSQNLDKTALVWSCGTGKTRAAIEWSKKADGETTLIICPKALKANWWREVYKWSPNHLVAVMTKEEFRRRAKELPAATNIIVDEVHNGFLTPHFKSQMSKALKNYLKQHSVPRVLLLSATVYTSSPWNIYNLAYLTGHIWNWQRFNFEFFDQIRMGMRIVPVAKKGSEKKLAEMVKEFASVVDIYDCLDVPLQNFLEPEYFALTPEQNKAIKANYDPVPIVRFTLQHEIENGILIGNEFKKSQVYETDKTERIKALCKENKKIAIVCRYNNHIDSLKEIINQEDDSKPVYIIRGDVKDRDQICLQAEAAEEAIVIIQSDCGIGFQLPSFPLCVFASMSYSYTSHEQMAGRFLRMDKPSPTTFMYLLTEGNSIDQAVYDAIKRKEDFKIELYRK